MEYALFLPCELEYHTVAGPTKISTSIETDIEYSTVYNTKTATATQIVTAPGKLNF